MRTIREIVEDAGGRRALGQKLGVESINTVDAWIKRGRIPSRQWLACQRAGIASLEELAAASSEAA